MSENPNPRIRQEIFFALKLATVMIGAALLLTLAHRQGWIDGEMVVRANNIVLGLALAAFSNVIPKMYGPPPRNLYQATLAQAVRRVNSWAMTLAFLVWAALWAFAPRDIALIGSMVAVGASIVITLGYTIWKAKSASGR